MATSVLAFSTPACSSDNSDSPEAGAGTAGSSDAGSSGAGTAGSGASAGQSTAGQSGGGAAGKGGAGAGAGMNQGGAGASASQGGAGQGGASAGAAGAGGDSGAGGMATCGVPEVTITHQGGTPQTPHDHLLPKDKYPLALCNDGSAGSYVFKPGFGAGVNRWILYLDGGGQCTTADDCKQRYNTTKVLMTSSGVVDGAVSDASFEGIVSSDAAVNPDFYDANVIRFAYCTSDGWTGDKGGDDKLPIGNINRWHFRGRQIVAAVIAEAKGFGLNEATEVFLMGSSAGGVGVVNEADDVGAMLPPQTRFVAMMDAGFFIDYPAYDTTTKAESTASPTSREVELSDAILAWGGRGDASCEALATDEASRALCRSAFDLTHGGHVTSPLYIRQSEYDAVQLKQLIPPAEKDSKAATYRLHFAQKMSSLLGQLSGVGIFASHDKEHGVINADGEWGVSTVDSLLLPSAVGAWYRSPCAPGVIHIAAP